MAKLLLLQLAFLLVGCSAQHHHHRQPYPHPHGPIPSPSYPPVKPPVHPPVKPPAQPPVKPPTTPPVKPPAHPPVKPPTSPPVKPPAQPPVKPPTQPPVKPPSTYPLPKKAVAVQGVVYCKNCSYVGIDTLLGANPLPGATVELKCRKGRTKLVKSATTDKNGYFFLEAPKGVNSNKATKYCRVYLAAPPPGVSCTHPTNLHGGIFGGILKPQETLAPLPYSLFTVGPFAFAPPKRHCTKN